MVIAKFADVNSFVSNVVSMIGFGLAIDYGLFIVSRFRGELADGYDTPRRGALHHDDGWAHGGVVGHDDHRSQFGHALVPPRLAFLRRKRDEASRLVSRTTALGTSKFPTC